ncbi:MAG: DUF3971 domain-containing protein [Pseudomonadota bacterium]
MTETERQARHRWPFVLTIAVLVLCLAVVAALTRLQAQPVNAGGWITRQVQAQVESVVPDARLSFRSIRVGMDPDYHPQIYLDDVSLTRTDGRPLAQLRAVQGDLAIGSLLKGDVQLRRVDLSGAVLKAERRADGSFNLSFGDGSEPAADQAATPGISEPGAFIGLIDSLFERPALAKLSEIGAEGITVNYSDAVSGRAWTGDGGQLRFFREGEGLLLTAEAALLTGRQELAALSATLSREPGGAATFSVVLEDAAAQDIASQAPALAWLSVVDASVSGALRLDVVDGTAGALQGSLDIGEGALRPNASTRPIPFSEARIALNYAPETQRLTFEDFSLDSAWGRATATGTAHLRDMSGVLPGEIVGQFEIADIAANPGGLYETERFLEKMALDFRLRLDPFTLDIGQAVVLDGETTAVATGRIQALREGWQTRMDLSVNTVEAARAMELWPVSVRPGTRRWFANNLETGTATDARAALRSEPNSKPSLSFTSHFHGADVRILRTLPPVAGGRGSVELVGDRLTVIVEEGAMRAPQGGTLDATGTIFHISNTRQKPAPAEVTVAAEGTITALLSTLDLEPFEFLSNAGVPVTLADGRAKVGGTLAFLLKPRIRFPDIAVDIQADLASVRSDTLVPNKTLSLPRAEVRVTNERLTIGGRGTLGRVAINGVWEQPLGQGEVAPELAAEIELSAAALDEFQVTLPPGSFSGEGVGELAMRFPRGAPPEYAVSSDLRGIALNVAPVGWSKPAGQAGAFSVAGRLGDTPEVDRISLAGPGLQAAGRVQLSDTGGFERLELDEVNVGNWLSGAMTLRSRGAGVPPAVDLRGASIDLRSATFGGGDGQGDSGPLSLELDRLVITNDIVLTDLRAELETAGGLAGVFQARMGAGGTPLSGRLTRSPHGPMIAVQSQDGGGVIRDAGVFRQVQGGQLALTLIPQPGEGVYDGEIELNDIRVSNAPSMAALLSAVSVVGLLEQLDGGGIVFSDAQGRFRITPEQIIITQSSAVGASLGISLDGIFNTRSRVMDFQGVLSPVYLVNGLGSFLTRRGEGLIGFNFTLQGAAEQPQVSVNPLSALTPGLFREIFRRPPPQVSQ